MKPGVLSTLTVTALLFAAPSLAEDKHPLFADGNALYKDFCAHCHGGDMVNPGTSSYDLRKYPVARKKDFVSAVSRGKGDMPAWGDILYPEEIDAIWIFVALRAGKADLDPETELTPAAEILAALGDGG